MVSQTSRPVRVLYSFPNKIGAGRICWTAWQQAIGLETAGAVVTVVAGSSAKQPPKAIRLVTTLCLAGFRIPGKILGGRHAAALHDWRTARWLRKHGSEVDVVHAWPLGALRTIATAKDLNIPVLLERPNTHTEFAYKVVEEECERIGVILPDGYEHKFDPAVLARELEEYRECDYLLCPSPFVERTFVQRGTPPVKILRHQYGYDASLVWPGSQDARDGRGLVMIYVGLCTPRKGLHHALKAWIASSASKNGRFLICGDFVPGYRDHLAGMLSHPGVEVLGHRNDVPELMRQSDLFILSTVEEGSALVTYEARGSGCVLVVSEASGAVCEHMGNGLIHPIRDTETLTSHLDLLDRDRELLARLRSSSMATLDQLTWKAAGAKLLALYQSVLKRPA